MPDKKRKWSDPRDDTEKAILKEYGMSDSGVHMLEEHRMRKTPNVSDLDDDDLDVVLEEDQVGSTHTPEKDRYREAARRERKRRKKRGYSRLTGEDK
jgi:hypothetical protein